MLTLEIKLCQMKIEKEKKNIWEIITIKKKLNRLNNHVEELEN